MGPRSVASGFIVNVVSAAGMRFSVRLAAVVGERIEAMDAGAAILLGVTAAEVPELFGVSRDAHDLPLSWKQLGRRRAAEARSRCDSENPADVFAYWAVQRWGDRVTVTVDIDAGEVWLHTDDADAARAIIAEGASE